MKTGEPGLHALAVFPSEVAFRAQQPHRGRREALCRTRRSLALLSQPCSCGPLGRKARARLTDLEGRKW